MGGPDKRRNASDEYTDNANVIAGKLNSDDYKKILDKETWGELQQEYTAITDPASLNAEFAENSGKNLSEMTANAYGSQEERLAALAKKLEQAKEGVGVYGVRRANYELARSITDRPGSRQTILTSGQNTTSVGSTGLMSNVGKK